MGKNYIEDSELSVTKFQRPKFRTKQRDTGELESLPDIPAAVDFLLPDGEALTASTQQEMLIGRFARPDDPPVTIDLQSYGGRDKGVSRCHAMVAVVQDKLTIQDLNSLNHTLLNGQMLIPMKRYVLRDGDILTLGRLILRIRYVD
jgi:pSer/pThr/pTyr-binding forkhead associated (FHA) protein